MAELTSWIYDNYPLGHFGSQWGVSVYDPTNNVWRLTSGDAASLDIYEQVGTSPRVYKNKVLSFAKGAALAYDDQQVNVPFVWYEAGTSRPWRMIYFGIRAADSVGRIFLATSVDAADANTPIPWERKDTLGNVLSAPIISGGAGGAWDQDSIDIGGCIKIDSTYYLYYNTITTATRKTGLATSTDLVTWTKHADNPFFTGVTDYADKTFDGTPDLTAGFFCADIVYWPNTTNSDKYVMLIAHYTTGGTTVDIDIYTSNSPIFTKANRTFIAQLLDASSGTYKVNGQPVGKFDTPRIITDDITRNIINSRLTGNDIYCVVSCAVTAGWNHCLLKTNKIFWDAVTTDVENDLDCPDYKLQPKSLDANVKALWLPGLTGTGRDILGTGYHLSTNGYIGSNGYQLTATSSQKAYWLASSTVPTTIDTLNTITQDFTVEFSITLDSSFTESYRAIIDYGLSATAKKMYIFLGGAGGPAYTLYFYTYVAGAGKGANVALGGLTVGQRYRFAITRDFATGKIYFFKDGTLLNVGGTAYAWELEALDHASFHLGMVFPDASLYWDGKIDEIRISNSCRWTADYVSSAMSYTYNSPGYLFTRVYDLVSLGPQLQALLTTSKPINTDVSNSYRDAANLADQSSAIGDFGVSSIGQYQQVAITLETTDDTETPIILGGYLGIGGGGLSPSLGLSGGNRPPWWNRRR